MSSTLTSTYRFKMNNYNSTGYRSFGTSSNVKSSGYGKPMSYAPSSGIGKHYDTAARVHGSSQTGSTSRNFREIKHNTVQSRTNEFESRSRPGSGSRPLIPGPGPLDANNRRISVANATSKLKQGNRRTDSLPRTSPLKGNHDISSTSFSSQSTGSSYVPSTPVNGHDPYLQPSPLRRRRDYASTSSLNSDSESGRNTIDNLNGLHIADSKRSAGRSSTDSELPNIHTSSRYGAASRYIDANQRDDVDTSGRSRRDSSLSDSDGESRRRSSSASRFNRNSPSLLYNSESNKYTRSSFYNDAANNNRGLLGLSNLGNTCYMNSMIQGLANTRPLLEYLCDEQWADETNPSSRMRGSLIRAFAKLVKSMWTSTSTYVSPTHFRTELNNFTRRFSGYGQQDAQEFLIFLVEGLHEDVNRVQKKRQKSMLGDDVDRLPAAKKAEKTWEWYLSYDNSFMVDLFVGQLKSSLECMQCGYVSNTFDPFWEIPLPLKKRTMRDQKLSECFDDFTREETLESDERPTCANCKKRQRCKKAFSIWKFPPILILHLKRFDPMAAYPTKLTTSVDFPVEGLDLSRYAADSRESANCIYDLYAVSNHMGTARGGHYTAYAKHPYSGDWHHFNDTRCSSISKRSLVSSEAYVLFYERRGSKHQQHHQHNSHL